MEKININYCYDEESKMYVAACKDLFGFIIYSPTLKELKQDCTLAARVYMKNNTLSGKDIQFNEIKLIQEESLSL